MNISDYLIQFGDEDAVALITAKEEFTYRDLRQATGSALDAFHSAGFVSGDRIGILGGNSLFWVSSYLAAMKLGAIAVPFATKLPPHELAQQIEQTGCRGICIDKRLHKKVSLELPHSLMIMDEGILTGTPLHPLPDDEPGFDEHHDAAWMLTSGTTSKPRVVRITHANIRSNTDSIIRYLGLTGAERMMSILPFYYCFGTSLLHTHLRVGGSLVLGDTLGFPEKVLDLMAEKNCTGFAGVPTTFQMYLRNSTFPQRTLPDLRQIQQAGGKLSNILIEELVQCCPQAKVYIMYGQTEATARLSYLPPDDLNLKRGSVGRGIPDVTLKVLNEAGEEVKTGEVGEIVAWGENISPGYLDEPEINVEKFVQGSLHTGDMATTDEEGYIYIVDRKSDFIKSYGNRVSSQEVEACIMELKEVVATAVIGISDLLRGEAIRAYVVLRSNSKLDEAAILNHCMKRLARYMVPRDVVFAQSLPVNQHGKVIKSELRKMAIA
ncbi:MAG: AMP-binding protein [Anaerolineae bacterium]|jgi:long-chain acyl-CoA synthetase|nr:AMP-binding protein [Anaerolineae bacterium]